MPIKVKNGQTILFIGDSITDCGRRGPNQPLGGGYVKLFTDLLMIRDPKRKIHVINRGIGGNTIGDLQTRWEDDVMRHKPDWLSIKIGINDLHKTLSQADGAVPPELFRSTYDQLLARVAKELPKCRLLLIDPFYNSHEVSDASFRKAVLDLLPAYIKVVHAMSRKYGTRLVKTQEFFQSILKHHDPEVFGGDAVHPNTTGHLVLAEGVYAALSL